MSKRAKAIVVSLSPILLALELISCGEETRVVVVYTALDRPFSERVFERFEKATGIEVRPVYDTESQKTLGLVERIRAERGRPRCDLFWNNEVIQTVLLGQEGLLQMSAPAEAVNYPASYRDPGRRWYGFALRARVLLVHREKVAEADTPRELEDLTAPRWKGQVGIAKPLFGTTSSHIACLFATRGAAWTEDWLTKLDQNRVQVYGGNKGAAEAVGRGEIAMALTDTDDALAEVEASRPVEIVYLGQTSSDPAREPSGTLYLPNTLAILKGAPHPESARKLLDFLLSSATEDDLATGPSAQIPIHRRSRSKPRVKGPQLEGRGELRALTVDWNAAAAQFAAARRAVLRFLD